MSEQITITSVEPNTIKGKAVKKVTDSTGTEYNIWPGDMFKLFTEHGPGLYEAEKYQSEEGYPRLKSAKYVGPSDAPKHVSTGQKGREGSPDERGASIERQVAIKAATEWAISPDRLPLEELLRAAKAMMDLMATGALNQPAPPKAKAAPPTEQTTTPKTEKPAAQLPLNGTKHDWNWCCKECLAAKIPVTTAMNKLGIEKGDQWPGTWDEALAKVKG